jgi:tRNA pseudouridine55 synthase
MKLTYLVYFALSYIIIVHSFKFCSEMSCYKRSFSHLVRMSTIEEKVTVPSGLIAIYKPSGWSSAAVVGKIRWILESELSKAHGKKSKVKVGHGGTLDPMAEGVLVLGVGSGTKLLDSYLSGSKGYSATAKLGEATDSLDKTGKVTEEKDCSHISYEMLESVIPKFTGNIMQTPPMFSALQVNGTRLYKLARQDIHIELEPRQVQIQKLSLIRDSTDQLPYFRLNIECGGGFYVRSLIADIARECGGVAHMTELVRTKQSSFTLDDCMYESDWNFSNIVKKIVLDSKKVGIS